MDFPIVFLIEEERAEEYLLNHFHWFDTISLVLSQHLFDGSIVGRVEERNPIGIHLLLVKSGFVPLPDLQVRC